MASDFLVRLGVDYQQFVTEMAAVSDTVKKAADEVAGQFSGFDRIGQTLTGVGTAMTAGITLPLAGIGFAAATAAGDFEGAMNRVKANIDGVTNEGLGKLDALAKKLGADTKFSALEAAQGMAEFAAAGYSVDQVAAVIGPSLDLAAAAQTNVGEASKITKDILGQFGLSAESAGGAVDLLAKAGTLGSGTLMEVANSLSYVGPNARAAGMDLAQTSAALLVLDESGIRGEKAGTALRAMLASLAEPSTKATQVLSELGIATTDAAGNFLPFPQIMENFKNGLQNAGGSADRMGALTAVFGREASAAATILTNQGAPALIEFEKQLRNSGGAADQIAKTMNSGMNGALEQLKGSLESAAIAAGQALIPAIVDIAGKIQWLVDNALVPAINWFKELPTPVQNVALGMVALAAAVGPVVLIAGQLLGSVSSINAGLAALGPIIGVQGLALTTLGTHFATLATGGITAAQGALTSFGTMITGLPGSITALGQSILSGLGAAIGSLPGLFVQAETAVIAKVGSMSTAITSGFSAIPGVISSMGTAISTGLTGALTSVTGFVSALIAPGGLAAAWAAVQSAGAAFVAWLGAAAAPFAVGVAAIAAIGLAAYTVYKNWDEIVNVLKGIWLDISNAASKVFDAVKGYVESALGPGVMKWLGGVWDSVTGVLKKAWGFILDIVDNGLKYIVNGAQSLASAIGATNTANALKDWSDKLSGLKKAADETTSSAAALTSETGKQLPVIGGLTAAHGTHAAALDKTEKASKASAAAAKAEAEEQREAARVLGELGVKRQAEADTIQGLTTLELKLVEQMARGNITAIEYARAVEALKQKKEELLQPLSKLIPEMEKLVATSGKFIESVTSIGGVSQAAIAGLDNINAASIRAALGQSELKAQVASVVNAAGQDIPRVMASARTAITEGFSGLGESIGKMIGGLFGGMDSETKRAIEAQKEKLLDAESDWQEYSSKVTRAIEGLTGKFEAEAEKQVAAEGKKLEKALGEYEKYKSGVEQQLASIEGKWEASANKQIEPVEKALAKAVQEYEKYQGDAAKELDKITTKHAEQLAQQVKDANQSLADRLRGMESYRTEAARKLEDLNTDYNLKLQKQNLDHQQSLATRALDMEQFRTTIQGKLAALEGDNSASANKQRTDLQQQLTFREQDYALWVSNTNAKHALVTTETKIQAEQQRADIQGKLAERESDFEAYKAATEVKIAELSAAHSAKAEEERAAIQAKLLERQTDFEAYKLATAAKIEEIKANAIAKAEEERQGLLAKLAEKQADFEAFKAEIAAKQEELKQNAISKAAEEKADLLQKLKEKEADFEAYKKSVNEKIDDIKNKNTGATGAMKTAWETMTKDIGGYVGTMAGGILDKLFNKPDSVKGKNDSVLPTMATSWKEFSENAGGHIKSMAGNAINALFETPGSWAEKGKAALGSLVSAFASMATSWVTEATGLKDTLNGIFASIKPPNLGSLGSVGSGGGASTGAPGGGANTGGGAGSFFDVAGVVSQITSAITGIIGVFQQARQENSLNAIEENTRDTESEVRNLRDDSWLRETHLMTKLDDLFQFSWIKLDEIIRGVGGTPSSPAQDNGLLTQAMQAVESHTATLLGDVAGFRNEVSAGFGNLMTKADDLWGTLRSIETNTKPVQAKPLDLANVELGLRNINLNAGAIAGWLSATAEVLLKRIDVALSNVPNPLTRMANFTSAIHDMLRDDLVPTLDEIHGKLFPQYAFYDRIEKSLAAKSGGGTSVTITFSGDISVGAGATRDSARELVDAIEPELLSRLRLAGAI